MWVLVVGLQWIYVAKDILSLVNLTFLCGAYLKNILGGCCIIFGVHKRVGYARLGFTIIVITGHKESSCRFEISSSEGYRIWNFKTIEGIIQNILIALISNITLHVHTLQHIYLITWTQRCLIRQYLGLRLDWWLVTFITIS